MKPLRRILRVISGRRRGSSRPIVAETDAGRRLVKLRGAAQGTGALVAEVVVGALAEALGLRVPARSLVVLESETPTDDRDQELADLLAASAGVNLAFEMLEGARGVEGGDFDRLDPTETAAVLWLDRFVLNPDRTLRNPNLLVRGDELWLIDHGAALRFQYDWAAVSEAKPREVGVSAEPHIFETASRSTAWAALDRRFAGRLSRAVIEAAVAEVPDSFLLPMLAKTARDASEPERAVALRRRRAAYAAFLWKRWQPPRAFANSPPVLLAGNARGRRPS